MKKLTLLGDITPAEFLRDFWHKKPLLIRQALPGFQAFLPRDDLFALAAQDDVESRLVTRLDGQWKMVSGPQAVLPAPTQPDWTLLVQGVNLHNDDADALLRQFRFIPDVRLDDLMISYASEGGGVQALLVLGSAPPQDARDQAYGDAVESSCQHYHYERRDDVDDKFGAGQVIGDTPEESGDPTKGITGLFGNVLSGLPDIFYDAGSLAGRLSLEDRGPQVWCYCPESHEGYRGVAVCWIGSRE